MQMIFLCVLGIVFYWLLLSDRFVYRLDEYARSHRLIAGMATAVVLIAAAVGCYYFNTVGDELHGPAVGRGV